MPLAINKRYRHFKRYRQIGEVLLRHGFGYLLQQSGLTSLVSPIRRIKAIKSKAPYRLSLGERLRLVLEQLGPTFIKFGQLASTRPDIIPPDIIQELEALQDNVGAVPFPEIRAMVESELERPIDSVFASLEDEPLAAASIGQVHRARLLDGTQVVIKVRRPGVEAVIATDLEIMMRLAPIVDERLRHSPIDVVDLVDHFSRMIRKELNYSREGRNIERFRQAFTDNPNMIIPQVFWEYTTDKVLTMDYIEGIKLRDPAMLESYGIDLAQVADIAVKAFVEQVFKCGFFHGDPHPGNLLVTQEGQLVFLDFGIVGRIDYLTMKSLARLMVAITKKDVNMIIDVFTELEAFSQKPSRDTYLAINELIDDYYGKTLKQLNFRTISQDLLAFTRQYPVKLPTDLTLLIKALMTIEGVGSRLVPNFNVIEVVEPFAIEWMKDNYNTKQFIKSGIKTSYSWAKKLTRIPVQLESVLDIVSRGDLQIRFQHQGLERLINRVDIASNRLTAGLIIGALIVASSFIMVTDQGPRLFNVPLVGLLGFLLAGMIGIWLVISIIRSGRY